MRLEYTTLLPLQIWSTVAMEICGMYTCYMVDTIHHPKGLQPKSHLSSPECNEQFLRAFEDKNDREYYAQFGGGPIDRAEW